MRGQEVNQDVPLEKRKRPGKWEGGTRDHSSKAG